MSGGGADAGSLREQARRHAAAGNRQAAAKAWAALSETLPHDAEAANALGNFALANDEPTAARMWFERAVASHPGQPALLFNLAAACSGCGDAAGALAALDAALAADPYFVQAMFQKGILLGRLDRPRDAARVFRDWLDTVPDEVRGNPRYSQMIDHATEVVAADGAALARVIAAAGSASSRRTRAAIAHLTGERPLYRSEPTFLTVPELPAAPFLDRALTPWLGEIEADWETIRDEAARAIEDMARFEPYVANPPGTALNQWNDLDHNPDWSALFLWKHGRRYEEATRALPKTAAALGRMPLLRLDARAPNAFLSRLAPRTHIPPHNGVTNARVTVHLPLIIPPGCGFRVGDDTREWEPGRAWVFDDTILHEAWNDSDEPRVILIFDVWHPLLDEAERDYLTTALRGYDSHYGRPRTLGDEL